MREQGYSCVVEVAARDRVLDEGAQQQRCRQGVRERELWPN